MAKANIRFGVNGDAKLTINPHRVLETLEWRGKTVVIFGKDEDNATAAVADVSKALFDEKLDEVRTTYPAPVVTPKAPKTPAHIVEIG